MRVSARRHGWKAIADVRATHGRRGSGERAAEYLAASLGSHVQIGHATLHVIGILKTANGFEDGGVFMPLNSAQSFFHKEGSSSV